MRKKLFIISLLILIITKFLYSHYNWPYLQGNQYLTGNNDEIIPKNSKLLWEYKIDYPILFPVPVKNKVLFVSLNHNVYCLNINNGNLLWEYKTTNPIIKSPVVMNENVIIVSGKNIINLNIENGQLKWMRTEKNYITTTPIIIKNKIIYGTRKKLVCRYIKTGGKIWENKILDIYGGTLTSFDNIIVLNSREYKNKTSKITAINFIDGKILWQKEIIHWIKIFTPVIYNKNVYISSKNILYSFDIYTGSAKWSKLFPSNIATEIIFGNQLLFISTEEGVLYFIYPYNGNIDKYFEFSCGKNYFSVVGENLFVFDRKEEKIYHIDTQTKEKKVFYKIKDENNDGHYFSIAQGILFIPVKNKLYAIGNKIEETLIAKKQKKIKGYILDNENNPVEASLFFSSYNFYKKTKTDENGFFEIDVPVNKKINLNISAKNYMYKTEKNINSTNLKIHLLPLKKEQKIVFHNIYFDYNKSDLKKESIPLLIDIKNYLKQNPFITIVINGYTDNIGSEKYNLDLSIRRAERIKEFLVKNGINENRIKINGFGEKNPIADNKTEEGRKKNRRIEFIIKKS